MVVILFEEDEVFIWFGDGFYIVVFDFFDGFEDFDEFIFISIMFSIYYWIYEVDYLFLE